MGGLGHIHVFGLVAWKKKNNCTGLYRKIGFVPFATLIPFPVLFSTLFQYIARETEAIPERNFSAYLYLLCRFLGNTQFFNLNPASQINDRNITDTETIRKLRGKLNINQRMNIVQVILLFWLFLHEFLQTLIY